MAELKHKNQFPQTYLSKYQTDNKTYLDFFELFGIGIGTAVGIGKVYVLEKV